jgi:excisionase family DNA binding protein
MTKKRKNPSPVERRAPKTPAEVGAFKLRGACRYLGGLHEATVRRLISRGLLRPNRATRHLLFSRAELDRFLAEEKP